MSDGRSTPCGQMGRFDHAWTSRTSPITPALTQSTAERNPSLEPEPLPNDRPGRGTHGPERGPVTCGGGATHVRLLQRGLNAQLATGGGGEVGTLRLDAA